MTIEIRVRLDDKVHKALKKSAAEYKRTMQSQAAMILESYLIAKSAEVHK